MTYRENAKQKDTLYYVVISYTKDGGSYTYCDFIRASDSFAALSALMHQKDLSPHDIWSQKVISAKTFEEKELVVE